MSSRQRPPGRSSSSMASRGVLMPRGPHQCAIWSGSVQRPRRARAGRDRCGRNRARPSSGSLCREGGPGGGPGARRDGRACPRRTAVVLEPGGRLGDRFGAQVRRTLPRAAAAGHQPRPLEHLRCLLTACSEMTGKSAASSFTLASPSASRTRIARRVGSASAPNVTLRRVVRRHRGRHGRCASVSSTMPDGAVLLSVTVNWLGRRGEQPAALAEHHGAISRRYSSIRPAARNDSVSCPLP